jgi:large subunit ribosomal protein L30
VKGFERGGIKKPFSMGGSLGYRKNKINELIRRMI